MFSVLSFGLKEGDIGITKTVKRIPHALEAHSFIQMPIEGQYLFDPTTKTKGELNKGSRLPGETGAILEASTADVEISRPMDGTPGFTDEAKYAIDKMSGNAERRHSDGGTIVSEFSAKEHSVFREANAAMYVCFCRNYS